MPDSQREWAWEDGNDEEDCVVNLGQKYDLGLRAHTA